MQKTKFLTIKNSLLELEKDFVKLKDRELKNRKVNIKRETKELLFKPIIKDRIIRDIRTLFEEVDYYKFMRVGHFWSKNYIEYESNCYKNIKITIYQ